MEPAISTNDLREQIRETARGVLSGEIDLIQGCRALSQLRHEVETEWLPIFDPIANFDSDMDDYYIPESLRPNCSPEHLERKNSELERYKKEAGPSVIEACR